MKPWEGRVWLNPPYGNQTGFWLKRLAAHGNGIALIFARTETEMFFEHIWSMADAVFFLKGRVNFYLVNGQKMKSGAGAPSMLVAYGNKNSRILEDIKLPGKYIELFHQGLGA